MSAFKTRPTTATRLLARGFATTARRLDNYAFVGLGQMGYQMAKNLQAKLDPTDRLAVFDVNADSMRGLEKEVKTRGARVHLAASAYDAARESTTFITCLPEPQHVRAVYEAIIAGAEESSPSPSRLLIDCSTIDPSTSREVARAVAAAGQGTLVDAPMSGGVVGATAGTLTFMLGGAPPPQQQQKEQGNGESEAVASRAESVLLHMGGRVLRCGPQGAGLAAKLANNYLLAVNNIATAEAMNLGTRWGLDPATLAGVINVSTGRCWPSEVNNPVPGVVQGSPAGRDYAGGFGIGLMRKDLRLAVAAAGEADARMELAGAATRVYDEAERDERCRGRDFSVVYRHLGGRE